jgi:hypothetical protein
MAIKELLEHLSYSKCDCQIDYREELGIVNGVCPKHLGSVLMVNGVRMEAFKRALEQKKIDKAKRKTV